MKPIDEIQQWISDWDPRSFFADDAEISSLDLLVTTDRDKMSVKIKEAASELYQNEG